MTICNLRAAILLVCTAVLCIAQSTTTQAPATRDIASPNLRPVDPDPPDPPPAKPPSPPAQPPSNQTPALVAYCSVCGGLISSTGNLYFTSFAINEFGPSSATFWRTGKYDPPNSAHVLYGELGDPYFSFGNVVWAYVDYQYYGYFSANYDRNGFRYSQIDRVSLAGGAPVVVAQSPAYIGVGELATDGSTLFWSDEGGIRSMSLYGGAVNTLVSSTAVSHLSLDLNDLYYTEGLLISRIPKTGGAPLSIFQAEADVTALYVWTANANYRVVFWGEQGGAVRSFAPAGGSYTIWQGPMAGRDVTSVGYDGSRALWIDCTSPGSSYCTARIQSGGVTPAAVPAGVGASHLQWDATSMYWFGGSGIQRYQY